MTKKSDKLIQDIDDIELEDEKIDVEEKIEELSDEDLKEVESIIEGKPKKSKKSKTEKNTKKKKQEEYIEEDDFDEDVDDIFEEEEPEKPKKTKSKKKKTKKSKKKTKNKGKKLLFNVVLIAIIVAVLFSIFHNTNNLQTKESTSSNVILKVNNEPITEQDINEFSKLANAFAQSPLQRDKIIDALISYKLINQEAEKEGVTVKPEQIDAQINEILLNNNLTLDDYKEYLNTKGVSYEQFIDNIKHYLLINNLVRKKYNLSVSNSDLINYLSNKLIARHILIASNTVNQTIYEKLLDVKKDIEDNPDTFCYYVQELSQDPGSKDNCGLYIFDKGMFVKEFEDAVESLDINEMTVVKTKFGYHLVQRLSIDNPLVKETVLKDIQNTMVQQHFVQLLNELKNNAEIEYLNTTSSNTQIEQETTLEPEVEKNQTTEEQNSEVQESEQIHEQYENTETNTETQEPNIVQQVNVEYFYSESDPKSKELTDMLKELELNNYINVKWQCIKVNKNDDSLCSELYGVENYKQAMDRAKSLNLEYAPTLLINNNEYKGDYTIAEIKQAICNLAGC